VRIGKRGGECATTGCSEDKDVLLRAMSLADGKMRSPDDRRLALVSYQWLP
jgi:hypothetical protein